MSFHVNKPVEIGLVPHTRELMARELVAPLEAKIGYDTKIGASIGPTKFLKEHTSTTEWEGFQSMLERAQEMDFDIFAPSLHTTLCNAVSEGWFERKRELGCKQMYRRIEGEWHTEKKKPGVKTGFPKRKFTAKSW